MKTFRRIQLVIGVLLIAACERGKSPPPVDSTAIRAAAASESAAVAVSPTRNWDVSAGPVLLVTGQSPTQTTLVVPDSATATDQLGRVPRPALVTLLGRGGTVQQAELAEFTDSTGCVTGTLTAAPPPRPWSVGFIGGVVAPIALDSVESLSPADSASLVTEANRLASAIPNDPAGRFAGLPFAVRSMWRFTIPGGPQVFIATIARQINQEATPLQEHTLLVAERAPGDSTYATVYSERSYGLEETIESRDVLAAVMIGSARTPALILSRDYGDSAAYGLIERGADGRWRPRWLSARRRC